MSPTPRDAQRASDNNPQRILEQAVKTIIGQMPPKLVPPRKSDEYPLLEQEVTEQVLSRHLAVQLSNQVPDDIMVTGGTSLMLRAPNAKVTKDLDIITYFYPTKDNMDKLCELMSEDPDDPFTYKCRHKDPIQSRPGESYEIDVYLGRQYKSTIKIDAVEARGSELNKDLSDFNDKAFEELQIRDPLLTSHRNNNEHTTLKLLSPEKYLAGKIAGLFPIDEDGKLQNILRWKDLRDIMVLATSVPIDADKFKEALADLVEDSFDKERQKYNFIIPKQEHIEELLRRAQENRKYIKDGFKKFHQPDQFLVETMVRVVSDLLLEQVAGFVWDLGVHDPQLQKLEEKNKAVPGLSLPELRDLDFHGWRKRNDTDIDRPPRRFDGQTNQFVQASATTSRNVSPRAGGLDNAALFGAGFGVGTGLVQDPVASTPQSGITADVLDALAGGQPYTPSQESPGGAQHDKPETGRGEATSGLADYLIEGGSWKGQGLGNPTTQLPPEHPQDNPLTNSQDNSNDQPRGLST
jgi:hypothetical protein